MQRAQGITYSLANLQGSGAQSDQDVIAAPGAGKNLYIVRLLVTVSDTTDLQITEGADAAGTRIIDMYAGANGGVKEWYDPPMRLAANTALKCTTDANNVKVSVLYYSN